MAKQRKLVWPEWWEWELKISAHMQKRFSKRDFTEIELRRMMELRPTLGVIATKDVGSSIHAFVRMRGKSSWNPWQMK